MNISFLSSANNEMEVINFDFFWVFLNSFIYLFIITIFFAFHGVLLNINGINNQATDYLNWKGIISFNKNDERWKYCTSYTSSVCYKLRRVACFC